MTFASTQIDALILTDSSHVFDLPTARALLREETERATAQIAQLRLGRTLWIEAAAASAPIDEPRDPARITLTLGGNGFEGDADCCVAALPWPGDSFCAIVVQHAGDFVEDDAALIDEATRTLEPGGTLFWFGMNPLSPWRAWLRWQSRRGFYVPRFAHAEKIRRHLLKRGFAPVALEFVGTCWPLRAERSRLHDIRALASLRGAYLLIAQKSPVALTPLRPRRAAQRKAARAVLAALPSHRASA